MRTTFTYNKKDTPSVSSNEEAGIDEEQGGAENQPLVAPTSAAILRPGESLHRDGCTSAVDGRVLVVDGDSKAAMAEHVLDHTSTFDTATVQTNQRTVALSDTRLQKTRWLGVGIIGLLNFMSAWSIIMYAPIADITQERFGLQSLSPINWLYVSCAFVYVLVSPISYLIIRRSTRAALVTSALCLMVGSWLRYLGTRIISYPCLLMGTVLCGASQPFALNIPTHFSNRCFPANRRVTATALMSLANPLGQAFGTFIVPLLATDQDSVPSMTLYVAILFTSTVWLVVVVRTHSGISTLEVSAPEGETIHATAMRELWMNKNFICLMIPFACYVAAFNAFASLTQQFIQPYGFSDVQAGIIGAAMIVVGLIASAGCAPIFDKTGAYQWPIRSCVLAASICYFGLIFAIRSYSTGVFVCIIILASVIGAASLVLLPVVLELATDVTRPVLPELSASVLWIGGQGLGGVTILILDSLRTPDLKYTHGLIFLILLTSLPVPFAMALASSKGVRESRGYTNTDGLSTMEAA